MATQDTSILGMENLVENVQSEKCPVSFGLCGINLWNMTCEKSDTTFRLERLSGKMRLHKDLLWFSCPHENTIDVYSCTGTLQRSFPCPDIKEPWSLHPLSDKKLLLAASSGLYVYNTDTQSVSHTLAKGRFKDVHSSESHIVALELSEPYHTVHIFQASNPPTHSHSFSLNHSDALRVLAQGDHVYVSAWDTNTSVCQYTLQGELVKKWGREGQVPGEFEYPLITSIDTEGCLLVVDCNNHRLQAVSPNGEISVVKGVVDLEYPLDVVIVGETMFVLHDAGEIIQTYRIK